ncbi:hypothetical protein LTR33_001831 [Friedmanniomyces endolithicus]|nr:hypothetical protein LTR33_001831 [Friedmanniomyces endolithicus]
MEAIKQSLGLTHSDPKSTADSNEGVRDESTRPTGETSELAGEGRSQTLPTSENAGRVQERGLGESVPGMSEGGMSGGGMSGGGMLGEGMSAGGMSGGAMSGGGMSGGGMSGGGMMAGEGMSGGGMSSTSGIGNSSGMGSTGFESGMPRSGLGESSTSGFGNSSVGMGSTGFQSGLPSSGLGESSAGMGSTGYDSGLGQSSTSGFGNSNAEMGSVHGSSMTGLGSTTTGLASSVTPGAQALGGEGSNMGGGIITTADGRQTYAADGYGGGSMGQQSTGSGLGDERLAGTTFEQSLTTANGSSLRDIDATSARGPSGLSPDGLGWSGVGSTGLDQSGVESRGNSGPAYPTGTSSSRTDYPTLNNPDVPMSSGNYNTGNQNTGNYGTGLDSTALGRDDINTTNRTAPADYDPNPASTEGSAEVAAENPEMLNKASVGTTDESAASVEGGSGRGLPHSSSRENESAIPFAGGERLGERHWGESKKVPE